MKIANLQKYIELYDAENYLFTVVGPNARKRGCLIFDEFYKICMWKSARQKQRYIGNKDGVEQATKEAFAEADERQKMQILCHLDGVSVPMASALLTVVYPERYAVIDIRCLEMLKKMDCDIGSSASLNTWLVYLDTMRNMAQENAVTPRELDMALFAMHREALDGQDYKNLY